ncbi:hypothetical protein KIM67_16905 [Flagellimonas sp. 389]|uniref:hypothetical protein n=1 Tax=Flagellimonas sp. 389 TaxID=2835862 RepID=UPI001BD4BA20|nr:hypothetical protein [Flagellimonas sp. 389]MBS9464104.1 hypothetical protein [Flagellimonas sp. 389]
MNQIKKLKLILCLFFIFSVSNLSAQRLEFESVERRDGTAFFAIDKTTGQISFMLDHGSQAGNWKNYGGTIKRNPSAKNLTFYTLKRSEGTAFFGMDGSTGQVYYMLDYGSNAGNWESYGGTLPSSGKGHVRFQAATRDEGSAFYAMDGDTGQVYFMLDYGSNAGNWKSYGGTIPK